MSDVNLIPMNELHIPEVLAIERAVFDTPWTEEMFRQEVRGIFGTHATVALLDRNVVGYQVAWFIEDEVHLVNIAVAKRYQTRGIGARLLNRLLDEALAAKKIIVTLEVRSSNEGAQAFYRRFFFRTVGVRKNYYSDNREDALLMVLDLTSFPHRRDIRDAESRARQR
jgi:ribosomal-protein-alanine N-acetyltransferase